MVQKSQLIPITLSLFVFIFLCLLLIGEIRFLNFFYPNNAIYLGIHIQDVFIGFLIYIKTAIDFGIFIGRLIEHHPTLKNRIAIEIGTALGNGIGTMLILFLWVIFKEVPILLAIMILFASFVLLELTEAGMDHIEVRFRSVHKLLKTIFMSVNKIYRPITSLILPDFSEKFKSKKNMSLKTLFLFSISIPFILGLDDFAGYISLFNIVNLLGFAIGVFLGHMILNIALFAYPKKTITIVKNQWISLFGTFIFIFLAISGFIEVSNIILHQVIKL